MERHSTEQHRRRGAGHRLGVARSSSETQRSISEIRRHRCRVCRPSCSRSRSCRLALHLYDHQGDVHQRLQQG